MKASSSLKTKAVERRRTPAEADAFFTRLSTPKYVKGSILPKSFSAYFQSNVYNNFHTNCLYF